MATDVESEPDAVDQPVDTLAAELGDAIAALPEHETFLEARAAVEADPDVQEKIRSFERAREEFQLARQTGDATREDLAALQTRQEELHAVPVMEEYLEAKDDLQGRLEELNEIISERLSVDFGGEAGGCCHD